MCNNNGKFQRQRTNIERRKIIHKELEFKNTRRKISLHISFSKLFSPLNIESFVSKKSSESTKSYTRHSFVHHLFSSFKPISLVFSWNHKSRWNEFRFFYQLAILPLWVSSKNATCSSNSFSFSLSLWTRFSLHSVPLTFSKKWRSITKELAV